MPRRVSLPGAAELFRATQAPPLAPPRSPDGGESATDAARSGSGRVRHSEKITVYVSNEELLALEEARLALRARHGLAVDRGRIVREAIAAALADLAARGEESDLVGRLAGR